MKYRLLNKDEVLKLINTLQITYPKVQCGLNYTTPFELVLSLILAAQCKDERVNMVRPILTNTYPTAKDIYNAGVDNVYNIIRSISFPNNKARHIVACSKTLLEKYNGVVPNTMDKLVTLPGIGRKSANIILSECFNTVVGIAVDTHVTRLAYNLRLTNSHDVVKIEKDLMKKMPKNVWGQINHLLVTHGKAVCDAKKPNCDICNLKEFCRSKN